MYAPENDGLIVQFAVQITLDFGGCSIGLVIENPTSDMTVTPVDADKAIAASRAS